MDRLISDPEVPSISTMSSETSSISSNKDMPVHLGIIEPTPDVIVSNGLLEVVSRAKPHHIGLYTDIPSSNVSASDSSSNSESVPSVVITPHSEPDQQLSIHPHNNNSDSSSPSLVTTPWTNEEKAIKQLASKLALDEDFVRSSSTGVNFSSIEYPVNFHPNLEDLSSDDSSVTTKAWPITTSPSPNTATTSANTTTNPSPPSTPISLLEDSTISSSSSTASYIADVDTRQPSNEFLPGYSPVFDPHLVSKSEQTREQLFEDLISHESLIYVADSRPSKSLTPQAGFRSSLPPSLKNSIEVPNDQQVAGIYSSTSAKSPLNQSKPNGFSLLQGLTEAKTSFKPQLPFDRQPSSSQNTYTTQETNQLSLSTAARGTDIYISPEKTFEEFAASSQTNLPMPSVIQKDFTDMFTATQLAVLKQVVELATTDPHHVLLGLRRSLEAEIFLRQKQIAVVKNWNKDFFKLTGLADSEYKFQRMRALAQDFVFTSETYGRLIISEMYLPMSEKTVHPLKLGGIAGGQKFVCQGILFKFAVDVPLESQGKRVWMYGGNEPCNEYAMKSAKHEFNGIIALNNLRWQGVANIRVALTTIIDFRGFRLSCQALLPIGKNTLVYGSDDGGVTHKDSPKFREAMKNVCETLNLKGHNFSPSGQSPRVVYGPVDLEGHAVGRALYAVDLARLFPPETPRLGLSHKQRAHFFRMLRPELVKQFYKPLSSDAHTAFGRDDASIHNSEVDAATLYLQEQVIPAFAATLGSKQHLKQYTDGSVLVRELHRWGINIRYLGSVRSKLAPSNTFGRHLILLEMILRCLKNMFRRKLRKQTEATRVAMDSPYAEVVLDLLNLFLGKDEKSKIFWRHTIKDALREMFVVGLTSQELHPSHSLKKGLDMQGLLDRFQVLTGVKLIPSASTYRKGKNDLILYTDLEAVQNTVTKHMQIVDYAEGALLLLLSEKKADKAEKLRLLSLAESKLKLARGSAMGNQSLYQLGQVFYMRHKVSPKRDLVDVLSTLTYYRAVIESSSDESHLKVSLKNTIELFYSFVSTSVWLQKKLFGSEIDLPVPTVNLRHPRASPIAITTDPQCLDASTSSTSPPFLKPYDRLKDSTIEIPEPKTHHDNGSRSPNEASLPEKRISQNNNNLDLHGSRKLSPRSSPSSDPESGIRMSSSGFNLKNSQSSEHHSLYQSGHISGAQISSIFLQRCCLVFERLAALNYKDAIKDASKYVKDACAKQGDALRWILEVSLYSPFVRSRLQHYLRKQSKISIPHCPQLFIAKERSVFYRFLAAMSPPPAHTPIPSLSSSSSSLTGSKNSDAPIQARHHHTVSHKDKERKKHETEHPHIQHKRDSSRRSNEKEKAVPNDHSHRRKASTNKELEQPKRHKQSETELPPIYEAGNTPRSIPVPVLSKLPVCTSLNFTECTPLTSTILSAILAETPALQELVLDKCSKISNNLATILGPLPNKRGPLLLKKLSLEGCVKLTNDFLLAMTPVGLDLTGSSSNVQSPIPKDAHQSHKKLHRSANNGASSTSLSDSSPRSQTPAKVQTLNLLHHLTSLNFSGCRLLDDEALKRIAKFAPKLVELNMSYSKVSDLSPLHHSTSLRSLFVAHSKIKDASLHAYISSEVFGQLLELDVSFCGLTDSSLQPLSRNTNLKTLIIGSNANGDKIVTKLSDYATRLTDLDLGTVNLTDRNVLVRVAEKLPQLSRLKLVNAQNGINGAIISMQKAKTPILHLEIPWCSVRDIVVYGIGTAFPNLQTLDLTGSQLSNAPLEKLKACVNLTHLNLSWCTQLVDPTLLEITAGCKNLQNLVIAHCPQLTSACLHNLPHTMNSLDISNCLNIFDLGPIRTHCTDLKHLRMVACPIPEESLLTLFGAGISLATINLKGCKQVSTKLILRLTKYCPLLTKATLDECISVTEEGLIPLLTDCPFIQRVTLTGVFHITDNVFIRAVESHGLRHISELSLSGCRNISDATLLALANNCVLITDLNLSGCFLVTSTGIIALAHSCKILLSLNVFGCKLVKGDVLPHLSQYCKLLERMTGVLSTGITEEDLRRQKLHFLVE